MNLRSSLTFSVFYLLLIFKVNGQNQTIPGSDTSNYQPVDSFFNILEKKHAIKFFYDNKLLAVQKLPRSLSVLPLEEAFIKLEEITKCTFVTIDSSSYILMPIGDSGILPVRDKGLLIIGNPDDYGKYKTATLRGTLLDAKTGNPLVGATVHIKKLGIATTTDKKGNFILDLPVGEHEMEFSYLSYERNSQNIKLVSNGTAEFEIYEKLVIMNEVIIHGEKSGSNISGTQMSLIRFDSKSLKELPLSTGEKDVLRSITLLPGIQSVGEFGTGFNVRGGSADQNLILLEDAPLFNSSHLFGLESVVNPDGVSSLTLMKAGIPAPYGERAASVTQIRLGNNPHEMHIKGGIGLLSSRLNFETPAFKNKANLLFGGRSSYSNWLLHKIPDSELMNSSANFYDLNALLNISINPKNRLTLFGYFSEDQFTYDKTNHYNYGSTLGTIRWSHTFNEHFSSILLSSYSLYNYKFTEFDDHLPVSAYQIRSSLRYNSIKYNISWIPDERYSLDMGINGILYRSLPGDKKAYDKLSTVMPVIIDPEKGIEGAAYFSGVINITGNLSSEIGMRYSEFALLGPGTVYTYMTNQSKSPFTITDTTHYDRNSIIKRFSGLEPRFSLRYTLNEYSSVKLSYNRINQYINLISNTSVAIPSDIWKLSSPQIRPLIADQVAIGYYRNFKQNSIETSLEIYYKTLKNITEYKNGAQLLLNKNIDTDLLQAYGYNYGIELYIKKNSGRLTGWISYTLSRSIRHTNSSITDNQIDGNNYFPSNYDKPHNLNIIANYYFTRRWHVSGSFSYNTGRPVTLPENKFQYGNEWLVRYSTRNKYRLPDYHRLDLSITCDESLRIKKKWKGSWTLSVINVYGRKNAYSCFYKKTEPTSNNNYRAYSLYTLYIIGRPLPTLTYNFTF